MTDDGSEGVPPSKFAPEPVESEIGETPDREYANFYFPPEGASLLFTFTEAVFQRVESALRNGSIMTYGDEGPAVYWEFIKQVDYPVVICEAIIECLTTDSDVQAALADLIATNPAIQAALSGFMQTHPGGTLLEKNHPLPTGTSEGNILGGNPDCDPDILYGQCLGIVQTANRMTEDFLQTWETYTNQGEVISDIVNAVPLLAELAQISGVTGILEYANDLVDSIAENYLADYTLEYEIDLACEIFCAAKDTCAVSISDLCSIMNARIGSALNLTNGVELLLSLMDQDISGFNVADLYLAAFVNMLNVANLVLPITWGIESFTTVIAAINEPNDDWITECEDCPPSAILVNTQTCLYIGQASGFGVTSGSTYTLTATGTYVYDPIGPQTTTAAGQLPDPFTAGVEPTFRCLILMCKIGVGGSYFQVGTSHTFTAGSSGELYFSVNEADGHGVVNTYADNSGILTVTVT